MQMQLQLANIVGKISEKEKTYADEEKYYNQMKEYSKKMDQKMNGLE